jgi:hypothetical protein
VASSHSWRRPARDRNGATTVVRLGPDPSRGVGQEQTCVFGRQPLADPMPRQDVGDLLEKRRRHHELDPTVEAALMIRIDGA